MAEPFDDLSASTLTLQNTGGIDHLAFDGRFRFPVYPDELNMTPARITPIWIYDHLQPTI
jgi:hypothetical protein